MPYMLSKYIESSCVEGYFSVPVVNIKDSNVLLATVFSSSVFCNFNEIVIFLNLFVGIKCKSYPGIL